MSALKPVTKREGPIDQTLLTVVAVLLGAGLVLWLTGQVAGYLHSQTWPRVTGSDMGQILIRLPRTPGNPAAAWPPEVRQLLPGAGTFYAIFAVLLALLSMLVIWLPLAAVIVLGPTQSHKTAGLAVPSVLEWDGPVLATSV
jgi:hypothetical protein